MSINKQLKSNSPVLSDAYYGVHNLTASHTQNPACYSAAPYIWTNQNSLVKMEAFFSRGCQQAFPQQVLCGVVRQFQVVDTRVHWGVTPFPCIHFAHHSQSRVQVCKTTWWQWGATSCELQECFPFLCGHLDQDIHKTLKTRTENKEWKEHDQFAGDKNVAEQWVWAPVKPSHPLRKEGTETFVIECPTSGWRSTLWPSTFYS